MHRYKIQFILSRILRRISNILYRLHDIVLSSDYYLHYYYPALSPDSSETILPVSNRLFRYRMRNVFGLISDHEASTLLTLCVSQNLKGDVVEIGSYLGKSTLYLAKACQISNNGIVHAVDTFKGNPGLEKRYEKQAYPGMNIFASFGRNIKNLHLEQYINVHKMTSHEAAKKFKKKARIVFIDADHSYDAVQKDLKLWMNNVMPGGLLILDDADIDTAQVVHAAQNAIDHSSFTLLLHINRLLIYRRLPYS